MTALPPDFARFALDVLWFCAWLALLIAMLAPLEGRRGLKADFLSSLVPQLLLILPMTVIAAGIHHFVSIRFFLWAADVPLWMRIGFAIAAGGLGTHVGYRWRFEIPVLRRIRAVRFGDDFDLPKSFPAPPPRLFALLPLYLLGLAQPLGDRVDLVPILAAIAVTLGELFIDATVNFRTRPVSGLS
jgi:hypothetical protein